MHWRVVLHVEGYGVSNSRYVVHVVVHGEWVMLWMATTSLLLGMTGMVQKVWRHEQCVQHVRV